MKILGLIWQNETEDFFTFSDYSFPFWGMCKNQKVDQG
jgi:hypothetical protein